MIGVPTHWAVVVSLLALASAGPARAQSTPPIYVAGEESDALAALRVDEEALFRHAQSLVEIDRQPMMGLPAGLTSAVPEAAPRVAEGSDVRWMDGLELPDLPVRWQEQVVRYLEYFKDSRRGRSLMAAWLRRSSRYGAMIREVLTRHEMPEDLRCVAMAESGFDPTVRSNRGAVGMWQFVRRTGEEYGLSGNRWIDTRMDPEASTDAAARYLGDLHRRFGSWELALAAYNMGYGALLRSIRKYNTNDYWVLAELEAGLPFETTIYVAKIMACAVVMRNPTRFGYDELVRDPPIEVEHFEVPAGTPLNMVARAAGIDVDEMRALNPELRRGRVPPQHARRVRVPATAASHFAERWNRVRRRVPAHQPYVVRFGEDMDDVAYRFGTREATLTEMNGIEDDEVIGAGTVLLVPAGEPRERPPEDRPRIAVPEGRFTHEGRSRVFYRTSRSDSLASIARFFQVAESDLRRWNHVDPDARLQHGMFLQIFAPESVDLSQAVVLRENQVELVTMGTEQFFREYEENQGRVRFRYTVVEGDTIRSLANRFGLSTGSIARINRFSRRTDLEPGQEIVIYADESRVPARYRRPGAPEPALVPPSPSEPQPGALEVEATDGGDDETESSEGDEADELDAASSEGDAGTDEDGDADGESTLDDPDDGE